MEKDVPNGPGEISDQPQDQQDRSDGPSKTVKLLVLGILLIPLIFGTAVLLWGTLDEDGTGSPIGINLTPGEQRVLHSDELDFTLTTLEGRTDIQFQFVREMGGRRFLGVLVSALYSGSTRAGPELRTLALS